MQLRKRCTFNVGPVRPFRINKLNMHYGILVTVAALYAPGAALVVWDVFDIWPALLISTLIGIAGILRLVFRSPVVYTLNNVLVALALGGTIPTFFFANSPIILSTNPYTYDRELLEVDNFILGGIYPNGQLSLLLDQTDSMNPETTLGKIATEVLQVLYVSYYLWGAIPFFYLLYRYIRSHNWGLVMKCCASPTVESNLFETALSARYLTELKMYLCGWLGAYFVTFLLNRSVPARSPRLYLKDEFEHKLVGLGLASKLISASTDDTSFGSFPSGHFNETLVCAIYAFRISKKLGLVILAGAAGIALATQVLRYHYFIDIMAGLLVCMMALFFGFNWSSGVYNDMVEYSILEYEERHSLLPSISTKRESLSPSPVQATRHDDQAVALDLDDCLNVTLEDVIPPIDGSTDQGAQSEVPQRRYES